MTPIPIFIDTDIGDDIDDAIALSYALLNPVFSVQGVSTVGHWALDRVRIVRALMDRLGREFPVAAGRETASTGYGPPARSRQLSWAREHLPDAEPSHVDAAQLIYDTAMRLNGKLRLVTFGPLTNVAEAFYRFPDLPSLIEGVYIMGGELRLLRREHNFAGDYRAADFVLQKAGKSFLATWSIGRQLMWSADDVARLAQGATPVAGLLADLYRAWGGETLALYDVVPVLYLEEPTVVDVDAVRVRVETTGLYTRGVLVSMQKHAHGMELPLCSVPYLDLEGGVASNVTVRIDVPKARAMLERVFGMPNVDAVTA